jgi:gliding motility-associated-like protein
MKSNLIRSCLISILLFSVPFVFKGNGQTIGCIDSIAFNQFYPSYFHAHNIFYTPQRDALDNVYFSGSTQFSGKTYWSIIKFDASNELVWYKGYRYTLATSFLGGGSLCNIEANGNLVFSTGSTSPYSQTISKTDNSGNLLWSKIIKHTTPGLSGAISLPTIGSAGELFLTGSFADNPQMPIVTAIDPSGTIQWSKKYQHTSVPKYHLLFAPLLASQNSTTLILVIQYYYNADIETDPAAKFGVQLVQINKGDGSIIQQTSFMNYNDAGNTVPNRAQLQKINYDAANKKLLLVFEELGSAIHKYVYDLFDDNLNLFKTAAYNSLNTKVKLTISGDNVTSMIDPYNNLGTNDLSYSVVDNNLDILTQKKIDLNNLGFPNRNFQADLAYKKNGILNFQLETVYQFSGVLQDYLFLFDHSPFYNNISACLGKDTAIFLPATVFTSNVVNPLIQEAGAVSLVSTDQVPQFAPEVFPLPKTTLCKAVSICDTIKLFGSNKFCMSDPYASFKLKKNPLCVRKTSWRVDTSAVKIISSTDTSADVKFVKSYQGYLYAEFGGCTLKDSIYLEVNDTIPPVNLGKDTIGCPGKSITLHAGLGYRSYRWQDNKITEFYTATQPGKYWVTVVDSCDNISTDTVIISPGNAALQLTYPAILCTNDTASIALPANLSNYVWQPSTSATITGSTWKLFPDVTTIYSISGERIAGCILSDTILVNVKPCSTYIYFPTAFTPNKDGINDIYKPSISGHILVYDFAIYNRYGQLVFKSTVASQGWNGAFKNSEKPLPGSYVWTCRYQFLNQPLVEKRGMLTLLR